MIQFTATTQATYAKMYAAVHSGKITQAEWTTFCETLMKITLMKNQAMWARMKNNIMTNIRGNVD
jgi:hypothetical protein